MPVSHLATPPRPRQRHAAFVPLLSGTELCRSEKDIHLCTPLYRPKWSPKTSPDEVVGIKKTMNVFNHHSRKETFQKDHPQLYLLDPLLVPVVAYLLGSIV